MESLFWICALCTIYSYFLYPLVLALIPEKRGASSPMLPVGGDFDDVKAPKLTLIVTAYNEAARITEKIENTLLLEYPSDKLELIVASDGSTDETDQIVKSYADRGVSLVRPDERLGKENAQWAAIQASQGEILVFSDVATIIDQEALRLLSKYFEDPLVGAVSSEDRFINNDGEVSGEGAYVRYEMWLRAKESKQSGLVGLSGSFFAARKSVCEDWDIGSPSDFNTALNCAKQGLLGVTAPDVLGYYKDLKDPSKEYQRKVRTVLRGMTGLIRHTEVLNVKEYGFFAFQVWSHKVMRWLMPWFMLLTFLVNASIAGETWLYGFLFIGQLAFYGLATAAHFNEGLKNKGLIKLIYFFTQVNVAIAQSTLKYLRGDRMQVWQPSAR